MVPTLSPRASLLLLFAALAFPSARYVVGHWRASPSRRDITLPPVDLGWRTPARLARSLALLALFGSLSLFIYTPLAEAVARASLFVPALVALFGAYFLVMTGWAFRTGLARVNYATYARDTQPIRFWATAMLNFLIGAAMTALAYPLYSQRLRDDRDARCFAAIASTADAQARLTACTALMDDRSVTAPERAALAFQRGVANAALGDDRAALADMNVAIRMAPTDADAHFLRGHLRYRARRFDDALADFTIAHDLAPTDARPLAYRGLVHAWRKERVLAQRDFAAVRRLQSRHPEMSRGEALLAIDAHDPATAVDRLSEVLQANPDDLWALILRAEMYLQLGETAKSWADSDRADRLRARGARRAGG